MGFLSPLTLSQSNVNQYVLASFNSDIAKGQERQLTVIPTKSH